MIKRFRFAVILFLLGSALALPAARQAITFRAPAIEGQSTVTVTDHKMTAGPIPSQCASPVAKFNFLPADPLAYQWSLLSGVREGDVIQWQFIQPNGSLYLQSSPVTATFNGNGCFWASMAIAGQPAASLFGNWQARVFYNGTQILIENFTISGSGGAVTITDRRMTGTTPPNNCAPPPVKTNFAPTDQIAYLWVLATGASAGDLVRWDFVQPNGSLYFQSQLTLTVSGNVCFWSGINIAGQPAAALLGNWQVRLFYNGAQMLTENFTITNTLCPTVSSVSPASGAVGSAVTINGTNFTGVSAVRFANNIAAQFNVVSATQITATAPSGATTGPITISKPNCADVQTPVFTVISQPAIEVTPANLDFGGVAAGQTKDLPITVRNTGAAALTVSSVTSSNARFTVISPATPFNVAANAQQSVTVRFAPIARGPQTGTLSINSNDPNRARVDLPLSGNGLAPVIEVTPASLGFGSVRVGQTKDLPLTVRNPGDVSLAVSSIASSNAQFSVISPAGAFNVAAGSSVTVNVRFAPNSAGAKTGALSINSNDPNRPRVDVSLTGTGVAPVIEVTPSSLSFGNVATGESLSLNLTVRNIGNATLNLSSITSSDPQFTISLLTTTFALPANASVNLRVRFAPTSAGAKSGTLSINSDDPARPRVDVPMTGTGLAPAIDVSPAALGFGQVPLAQTKDLTLTIRNTGAAALKVNSITSSNEQFSVTQFVEKPSNALRNLPLSIAPNSSVEVTVRFRPSFVPSSIGSLTGALTINSNDPNRPRVDVALSGTGLGPLIAAASSLSFGGLTVCLATPNTANLTVTNTGNAPLVINSVWSDNQAFALASRPSFPLTIAPGAGAALALSFYTTASGSHSGRLTISSNAVNNPGLAIQLSGEGAPIPQPAVSQLVVSRTTMSHGRADNARPITPFNPLGLVTVTGFSFPGAPLPPNSIAPGVAPLSLINDIPALGPLGAIPSAPDPFHISIAAGLSDPAAAPIVLAAANIPSCCALVVAEGVTAPNVTRWERTGARFGSGNLYASVSIPGTGIFAGKELVTEAELDAYTANSIIYESPDFGLLVAPAGQNGGSVPLQARARRLPTDPQCQTLLSQPQSTSVEYSGAVRLEIPPDGITVTRNGGMFRVEVTAQIFGNFDPAINTVVRFAFDGNDVDLIADVADPSLPGAPRIIRHAFNVSASEECRLAKITVVASSTGNAPAAFLPPINPFLEPNPTAIGLFTFRSGGCTIEDTRSVFVRVNDSNCGGGAPSGWIQGVVTNAATGQPIFGATVSVAGQNISATTGEDGSYALNNVPAGSQTLNASANGFIPAQVSVSVTAGQLAPRNIALTPQTGGVSGFVINASNNQPIAGATVSVKGANISTTTGGAGSYTLANVPVGPQTLDAAATNFDPSQAVVSVIPDQTGAQDFFLTPKVGVVTGTVRNAANNQPIAGATVSIGGVSATTAGNGSYTLNNVPAGAQTLNATATGFNPASASVTVLAGQTMNRDIAMSPLLGAITGVVRNDDNGDPVSGTTITVGGTGLSATSGADGTYTLSNVPAGPQTLTATINGFVTEQRPGVNVVGNQTIAQDFTLIPLKGVIRGRVTDSTTNQPILNAEIELLPFPLVFANSDAGGNYTMIGVPTGQQAILASAAGYYSKIALVNIVATQTSTQDFALTPQVGTVTGIVYDNFSQPVIGATVAVAGTNIAATTGSDGIYTLSNVPVGAKTLNVSATGFTSAQATVNVFANETIFKDIYLQTPVGAVRGTVRNAANNQPVPGAQLLVGIPFGAIYYSAITDANGNYALNDVKAGSITIYCLADGFQQAQANVTVVANQTTTQNFLLQPDAPATGSIAGVVKNASNNQAVSGATITVVGTTLSRTSGGDGGYTLSNVPAGAQTLNASKTDFRPATIQVTVIGGQTVTQDILLTPGAGTVTGTIRNAANADPIVGATISVAGTNLSTISGAGGTYTLSNVPAGAQTLNASANGFIATQLSVNVADNQTVTQNISLSPTLQQGEIRITLNWTKDGVGRPDDLDAHLIGPNPDGSCFHVYYIDRGSLSSAPFAQLEVDNINVSGRPPTETIRISRLSPGIYRFYVHNYGAEEPDGLSRSRATAQIFGSSGQMGNFTVPAGAGLYWTVFEINGQTGAVTTINQLATPATNCR
jgi:hypothetical protein